MKQTLLLVLLMSSLFSCQLKRNHQYLSTVSRIPNFQMQLLDSASIFQTATIRTGEPILIFYFRPDCPYCRRQTKELIANIKQLKNVHLYMISGAALDAIRQYSSQFRLGQFGNIVIGKDYQYSFVDLYQPGVIPFLAIYNGKKQLLKIYHGEIPVQKLVSVINS